MQRKLRAGISYKNPNPTAEQITAARRRNMVPEISIEAGTVVELSTLPPKVVDALFAGNAFEPEETAAPVETVSEPEVTEPEPVAEAIGS